MRRSFGVKCTLLGVGLGLLLGAQSCTLKLFDDHHGHSGPPAHAPAHGYRARHTYLYYPSSYVYFDLTAKVYFYMTGGVWRQAVRLPSFIAIDTREAVSIELDTDRPYRHFNTHKKKYPSNQIRKKYTHGHTKREQPPGKDKKNKRPPGHVKNKNVHRAKQPSVRTRQPARVEHIKKEPQGRTGKKDKQPARVEHTKKEPQGRTGKKDKETGKDKDKGKKK